MKDFYGPYFRSNEEDKWHWVESCPYFPQAVNPQARLSTRELDEKQLCPTCKQIEGDSHKKKFYEIANNNQQYS